MPTAIRQRMALSVCSNAGILRVVFATETLAAGINMPARCTVISTLSRRRAQGVDALTHNELLQMAGRAGRRGYDTQGAWRGCNSAKKTLKHCAGR